MPARSGTCEPGLGAGYSRSLTNLEPQSGMRNAVNPALGNGACPPDIGRERTFWRRAQETMRDELDPGKDERRDPSRKPPSDAAHRIEMEIALAAIIECAHMRHDEQQR